MLQKYTNIFNSQPESWSSTRLLLYSTPRGIVKSIWTQCLGDTTQALLLPPSGSVSRSTFLLLTSAKTFLLHFLINY